MERGTEAGTIYDHKRKYGALLVIMKIHFKQFIESIKIIFNTLIFY